MNKLEQKVTNNINIKFKNYTELMKALLRKEAESWYDVCRCAWEIYQRKEWESLGYASAREYVQAEFESIGFSYSAFMYRVRVGQVVQMADIQKKDVANLGWTKFREIASYVLTFPTDTETLDTLMKEAPGLTTRELQQKVKELKERKIGIQKEPTKILTFKLVESQVEIITQAIQIAKELCQTDNTSVALCYICADFLLNHSTDSQVINELREKILAKKENTQAKIDPAHNYSGRRQLKIKKVIKNGE